MVELPCQRSCQSYKCTAALREPTKSTPEIQSEQEPSCPRKPFRGQHYSQTCSSPQGRPIREIIER